MSKNFFSSKLKKFNQSSPIMDFFESPKFSNFSLKLALNF